MASTRFPASVGEGQSGGRPRVVIAGAGVGGLACARGVDGKPDDVATRLLKRSELPYPLRTVFRHSSNVRFRQATVTRVDLATKVVRLDGAPPLSYDYLLVANGSDDNHLGHE